VPEMANETFQQRVQQALQQILDRIPSDDRVRDLAGEVFRERLSGTVLAGFIKDVLEKLLASRGLPEGEELKKQVAEQVAGSLDAFDFSSVARDAARQVVDKSLAESGLVSEDDLAARFEALPGAPDHGPEIEALRAEIQALREAMPEPVGTDELEKRVETLESGQAEVRSATRDAGAALEELRAAHAESSSAIVAASDVPDEDRIRELAREAAGQVLADAPVPEMEAHLDEEKIRELVAAETGRAVADRLNTALESYTSSEALSDRIAEIALSTAGPSDEETAAHVRELVDGVVSDRVRAVVEEQLTGESIAAQLQAAVGTAVAERLGKALEAYTSSEALAARIDEVVGGSIGKSVTEHLASGEFEEKIRALAPAADQADEFGREIAALRAELDGRLAGLVGDERFGALESAQQEMRALLDELKTAAVPAAVDSARRLDKLEEALETLPAYLQGTARIYQRLNGLEKSLERMPQPDQVDEEIRELRRQVASTAEKISDMPAPQTVREMAESALADTLAHIDRLEAEHSEGRAGEHLRELVRREVEAAGGGGDGGEALGREEVARLVGGLMDTPQFAEKVRALVPASEGAGDPGADLDAILMSPELTERIKHVAAAEGSGGFDLVELREQVERQVKEGIADMLHTGDLKAELGSLVSKGIKAAQHQELTSTRMLRLKDVQAATDPDKVQAAVPEEQVDELLQRIVSSDDFKVAIDDRFRTMLDYIKADVIPKQVKKHLADSRGESG